MKILGKINKDKFIVELDKGEVAGLCSKGLTLEAILTEKGVRREGVSALEPGDSVSSSECISTLDESRRLINEKSKVRRKIKDLQGHLSTLLAKIEKGDWA